MRANLTSSVSPQRIAFAVATGGLVVLSTWLFNSASSPIQPFALAHTEIGNVLVMVNALPVAVGLVVSGNVHQPSVLVTYASIFAQWALLGYGLSLLLFRQRRIRGQIETTA